jgi:3-hydroxybutyryl-CoA dehydrogenase
MSGFDTLMVDVSEQRLSDATVKIRQSLAKLVGKSKITQDQADAGLKALSTSTKLDDRPQSDLFIEAVPEDFSLKKEVFGRADSIFAAHTLFASNTSALSISKLAQVTSRPQKFIGLHFFNPVPIMKLLEIVVGEHSSEDTLAQARWMASRLGKEAIVVKDSPGFATSRLGICLAFEAIRMLEGGVANAEDLDKAMVLGYGHPMGPLRLTDLVGLDVRLAIGKHLHESLKEPQFRPPELLQRMVREGKLGQKSSQGFYSWAANS